ncbi:hypothetical protein JJD41_08350 [Oxynema sp. CENA135]|uniref:asparagine synthetase B family protein n=1 Tax=Oxynema sp. CENA135 TaxID=984206 RepID=UPI00190CA95A|nr:asparagine synthase-related protein [Oxynema sp. CENA135]MBK4729873.1 hypothetical protein [Oxynema sp. CENA135]
MGGIFGTIGDLDAGVVAAMGRRLQHRGHRVQCFEVSSQVTLGEWLSHEATGRLTLGHWAMVADGDIYNALELQKMLADRGIAPIGDRPELLILQGFREFGDEIFNRVNGDFALALWDDDRRLLRLVRDPVGMRPLYYWHQNGIFAFASEYKALLAIPQLPVVADRAALQTLQYTKYPPTNRTLIENIVAVPPGHCLEYEQGKIRSDRYWDLTVEARETGGDRAAEVRDIFLEAVRRQTADLDRQVGVTLSGGVDSASVAAAIRKVRPDLHLHAFTCGYGESDPEILTAAIVAEAIGCDRHPIYVTPHDIPPLLPQIVWHLEDPIARSETVQKFVTAGKAAEYVDVVLAGYASDGLYGGMPKHKLVKLMEWLPPLKTPLTEFYSYTQTSRPPQTLLGKALHWAYYRGADAPAPAIEGVQVAPPVESIPPLQPELLNTVLKSGVVNGVGKWLPKAERLHIAHGVTVRSPFLDLDLIDNAFAIPERYKIYRWREKHIFREAVKPLLPPAVLNRPKFPQAMKYDRLFSDVLDEICTEFLTPERVRSRGFFSVAEIENLRRRPKNGLYSSERSMRLWTAILTELWAQLFIDGRGEKPE